MSVPSRLAYFGLQSLIGSRISRFYREFLQFEKLSSDQLRDIQQQRIAKLLKSACNDIAYFREVADGRTIESLDQLPVLTKDLVRSRFKDLTRPDVYANYQSGKKKWGYSWLAVQTGGSTAMPTTVIHGPEYRDRGRAGRLYSQYLSGFPIGTPYIRLWGSMSDINASQASFRGRVAAFLSGEAFVLNAFRMNDDEAEKYIRLINESKAEHLMAYADAACQLARYSLSNGRTIKHLRSVMACAGTVTDEMREVLKAGFGNATIHNKYGSRDCAEMACECDHGGLHVYSHNVVIEVVDDRDQPVRTGETGRILVTTLANHEFPLVRYEIGDMGSWAGEVCGCGRPAPILKNIEGRTVEYLQTVKGGFISPIYIIHLIGVVHNPGYFRRYQLVQYSLDSLELKLQMESGVDRETIKPVLARIQQDLQLAFGLGAKITIQFVDELPPSPSGKYLPTLNRINMTSTPHEVRS